jgi:hypothetical protein
MLYLVLFLCLSLVVGLCIALIIKSKTAQAQVSPVINPVEKSDFPQYDGMDTRRVLVEFNATYPQYTLEIMSKDSPPPRKNDYREDRVRIYTSRSGKVLRSIIG